MSRRKLLAFADAVIVLCLAAGLLITASVLYEYHRLDTVMPSGVLSALFGFWGGELLFIALRQIFGSDALKKSSGSADAASI